MRRFLDGVYRASGGAAACFLFLIAATIVAQIVGRFFGIALDSTESGGFSLAATTFLGLAYTLKHGAHIRVSLLVSRFRGRVARAVELWCSGFAAAAMAFLTWQTILMVHDSWRFGEISPGLLAIPFWIPQSGMLLGATILTVALIDEFWLVATGRQAGYEAPAETALGDHPQDETTQRSGDASGR
ncbi:MAG: TRAP transporter small permease [Rhodospirillales bacterium]|nr:TRAP transporter small permease [Rhodospirillales bacterium]